MADTVSRTGSPDGLAVISPEDAHRVQRADGLAQDWRDTADARYQPNLRKARAQDRMTRIRGNLSAAADEYLEGVRAEDWKVLGYPDIESWRDGLLSGLKLSQAVRQSVVVEMTADGRTVREIEAATGAGLGTISRDQKKAGVRSGTRATPRQKAARKREAARPKKKTARAPAPAKKKETFESQAARINAEALAASVGPAINAAWHAIGERDVRGIDLDADAWTVTVRDSSRDEAARLATALREAAISFTALAKLIEQAISTGKEK